MLTGEPTIVVTNISTAGRRYNCDGVILEPGVPTVVPKRFVEQYGGIKDLRFDFQPYVEEMAVEDELGRPLFDFWAPMSMVDGYGRHALAIYKGFRQMGLGVKLRDAGWYVSRDFIPQDFVDEVWRNASRGPAKVGLIMSVPYDPNFRMIQSVSRIAITQFETDHIPEFHIKSVNTMHHLITTSGFQPAVWKKSGLSIPISVLTPGVDTDEFKYNRPEPDGKFKVLILGALTGRKNLYGAVRIFQRASQGDPKWELLIKTRPLVAGTTEFRKFIFGDNRIKLYEEDIPPNGVAWLYGSHDAFLWPSKGEGCGLPPLEAMACGMEVICADNSGMSDFLSDEWAYPIKTDHMEPADSVNLKAIYGLNEQGFGSEYIATYGQVGNWWVPSEDHGAKQLRKAYELWSKGKGKGRKAAEYVSRFHTLRHQSESVWKVVERYM